MQETHVHVYISVKQESRSKTGVKHIIEVETSENLREARRDLPMRWSVIFF